MADNSFKWARERKLIRVNEMHGKEEVRLITKEKFRQAELSRTTQTASGSVRLKDGLLA